MLIDSVEYIDDINKAPTARIIYAREIAVFRRRGAFMEYNRAGIAQLPKLQVQRDGKSGNFNI
jgi:hypothetical protein